MLFEGILLIYTENRQKKTIKTERRGQVFNTPASYSRGLTFDFLCPETGYTDRDFRGFP
jgi:hypothetical protein